MTNLLKTDDQTIHATKLAQTKTLIQPRQRRCPQSISADGQAVNNAAHTPTILTTSVNLKTMKNHLRHIPIWVRLLGKRTNEPIKILRKNEVVHQSYQHAPVKILQNLFHKMVQQHHQQHSQTQERVVYVRPKGTLLRIVPKNKPINRTQRSN